MNGSSSTSMSDSAFNEEDMPHSMPLQPSPSAPPSNRSRPSSRTRSEPDIDISAPPPPSSTASRETRTKYHKTSRGITEEGSSHAERQPSIEGENIIITMVINCLFACGCGVQDSESGLCFELFTLRDVYCIVWY